MPQKAYADAKCVYVGYTDFYVPINIIVLSDLLYRGWRTATLEMAKLLPTLISHKWRRVRVFRALVDAAIRPESTAEHSVSNKRINIATAICQNCGGELHPTTGNAKKQWQDTGLCELCYEVYKDNTNVICKSRNELRFTAFISARQWESISEALK